MRKKKDIKSELLKHGMKKLNTNQRWLVQLFVLMWGWFWKQEDDTNTHEK